LPEGKSLRALGDTPRSEAGVKKDERTLAVELVRLMADASVSRLGGRAPNVKFELEEDGGGRAAWAKELSRACELRWAGELHARGRARP
jgi:hypothetical protein